MPDNKPTPRPVAIDERHERFYMDVSQAALNNKLSDAEICALLAVYLGRMASLAKPGSDQNTIIDTIVHNLHFSARDAKRVHDAIGKGH